MLWVSSLPPLAIALLPLEPASPEIVVAWAPRAGAKLCIFAGYRQGFCAAGIYRWGVLDGLTEAVKAATKRARATILQPRPMPSATRAMRSPALQRGRRSRVVSHAGRARPSRVVRAVAVLGLCLSLAACTTGRVQPVKPIPLDAGGAARLISAYRAANGLGPVRVDSRLMKAAAAYARVMGERDKIGHRLGKSLPRRVSAVGYDWSYAAENLAASYTSIDDAMRGWKASAGHRRNLLSPRAEEIGIAAVATPAGSDHRNYWALILAAPRKGPVVAGSSLFGWIR